MPEPISQSRGSSLPEPGPGETHSNTLSDALTMLSDAEHIIRDLREALKAAEGRERILANELQHRVRNMLAVIRSIFRRSLEVGASGDEFAEHFAGRLNAVARYQPTIAESDAGVDLEDVIRGELLEVHCLDGPRLTISGPAVPLRGKSAELMGLAIHELTTNAIKFGALYHQGSLRIKWSIVDVPVAGTLRFRWKEEGVAPLTEAPRPRGFGRQIIEEALPYQLGATTTFDVKPGGVDCVIILPGIATDQLRASHVPMFDPDTPLDLSHLE